MIKNSIMAKTITAHTRDYHASLLEGLSNKEEAVAYLKVALEEYEQDNDAVSFTMALRNVAEAQ